ncbi:hypothetical protein EON67_09115, partial [archaeon]
MKRYGKAAVEAAAAAESAAGAHHILHRFRDAIFDTCTRYALIARHLRIRTRARAAGWLAAAPLRSGATRARVLCRRIERITASAATPASRIHSSGSYTHARALRRARTLQRVRGMCTCMHACVCVRAVCLRASPRALQLGGGSHHQPCLFHCTPHLGRYDCHSRARWLAHITTRTCLAIALCPCLLARDAAGVQLLLLTILKGDFLDQSIIHSVMVGIAPISLLPLTLYVAFAPPAPVHRSRGGKGNV